MSTNPNIALLLNEGIQHQQAGNLSAAEMRYRKVLQSDANNIHALHVLGVCCYQQQKFAEAVVHLQRVVSMQPEFFPAFNHLGIAEKALGKLDDAIAAFRRALQIQPHYVEAEFNLGLALEANGDVAAALACYRNVVLAKPDFAAAHTSLGNSLRKRGDAEAALEHLQTALTLTPTDAGAHCDVALAFTDLGRYSEAMNSAKRATQLDSTLTQHWEALGSAQRLAGFNADAIISLKRAVALADTLSDTGVELQFELGVAQLANGEMKAGKASLDAAHQLRPDWLKIIFERDLALPPLYKSDDDIVHWREQWLRGMDHIEKICYGPNPNIDAAFEAISAYAPFFVHYQHCDNTDLQKRFGKLVETITARTFPRYSRQLPLNKHDNRVRIGFVSSYFRNHSVALFFAAWLTDLDQKKFEVFAWNTGDINDKVTRQINAKVEHFYPAPKDNLTLMDNIRAANIDILIYLDVGMDPRQQLLASLRLAPIQCAAYGHPVTTGLANVDYFLGAAAAEPDEADAHYSEKLIRLPKLAVKYPFPDLTGKKTPAILQQRSAAPLLLCAQRLFKILPEFDRIAARIACQLPGCRLAFFQTMSAEVTRQFTERLAAALHAEGVNAAQTIFMLPAMPYGEFLGAIECADVVLDTTYFSGGNTSFDILAVNTPIVTYRAPMMRGRQTAAMLNILGVPELIAHTHEDYVEIAVDIASDTERRLRLRHRIQQNSAHLFDDASAITALENTLLRLANRN